MKKIIIVLIFLIGIIVGVMYLKNISKPLDGDGEIYCAKFREKTFDEWRTLINDFYVKEYNYKPEKINMCLDENENLCVEIFEDYDDRRVVTERYEVDKDTGIAKNILEQEIDLEKGEILEKLTSTKYKFSDSLSVAIAQINSDEKKYVDELFYSNEDYEKIKELDMRNSYTRNANGGNKFLIIPKNADMNIKVWICLVNNDGEIEKDQIALENHKGCLILYTNEMETRPEIELEFKINDYEFEFPVIFNGFDGKLNLKGVEMDVIDITK